MAAFTATDWTVTVLSDNIHHKVRHVRAAMTLATVGNYPSNGIPLPAAGAFGFRRNRDAVVIDAPPAGNTRTYVIDAVNDTLRITIASTGAEVATTVSNDVVAGTVYVTARGW